MILEYYIDQDLDTLGKEVKKIYKILYKLYSCNCEKCKKINFIETDVFHPEVSIKDAWKCLELLQQWGYVEMSSDNILYTFSLRCEDGIFISGDGISSEQSICNLFVKTYDFIIKKYNKSNLLSEE